MRASSPTWQRPTLPGPCGPSTIGAGGLNGRVRDGYAWNPSAIATRSKFFKACALITGYETIAHCCLLACFPSAPCPKALRFRISPRPISTRQLHALPRFHPEPINLVFFQGSYELGNLILRRASRLDAFSAYPSRTWLPSHAPGGTTGTPAVRPSRSSRTKDSPSQISYARDR